MAELRPDGYVGTPSFLKIILDKADEMGMMLGEPHQGARFRRSVPGQLRDALLARGIAGYQAYAIG